MPHRRLAMSGRTHPVVIGIAGDSAAGKTTFAEGLATILGPERTVSICADDYHRHSRAERARTGITPHDPAGNYMDILEQHLFLLRDGAPVLKPVYRHAGGTLQAPEYVEPKTFIIVEGLLAYATAKLRAAYDVKFYLEPQEQLRLRWKFQRDTIHGGYTVDQVMSALDKLKRDSAQHVAPQRAWADMVVSFYPGDDKPDETGDALNVRHILRPTLPYLDLAPLLEAGADKGFELELARDVDGRPVDALHIYDALSEDRAAAMKDYLWKELTSSSRPVPGVGIYRVGKSETRVSHTLALSQLVVTHYLLNAALGDDAARGE
jgi:phosphoribulokinase